MTRCSFGFHIWSQWVTRTSAFYSIRTGKYFDAEEQTRTCACCGLQQSRLP